VGFIDDDPNLMGRRLCGIPVKNGSEWIRQAWNCIPQIWISSQFISDQRAQALAQHWNGEAIVRRAELRLETIQEASEQACFFGRELFDDDREILRAESDGLFPNGATRVEHRSPFSGHA